MGEQSINTNPWAEKLQQVSLPEPMEAKQQLLRLLEREMPLPPKKDNRRWVLVIILLLLLLGVCNCPGRLSSTKTTARHPAAPVDNTLPVKNKPGNKAMTITTGNTKTNLVKNNNPVVVNTGTPGVQAGAPHAITASHTPIKQRNGKQSRHTLTTTYGYETETTGGGYIKPATVHMIENEWQGAPAAVINGDNDMVNRIDTARPLAIGDTTQEKITVTTGSTKKKKVEKGWAVATGFNQSFPTGHRQNINMGDYIPFLQLRYHFNEKWHVQAELAIHAPQYVNDLPLLQRTDSVGGGMAQHSVFLEKLIYWQVPLGIYYSPFKNAYAGAGIRPGILSNATGLYEDRITRNYPANTVLSSKTQSLKKDSSGIYKALATIDWQWYADINYQWKQLMAGLRYNQGIGNFIITTIPGGTAVKAGNSSAQLYIRYTLWRQRPPKKLPVK